MPEVRMKHIVSFSSEDKSHKAENLLGNDTTKKWRCEPGEKQACVVFQLEKCTKISSIDIGNDGSAFVEVLVGRSGQESVKYQVLLVASSFMSPQESRVGTSPTRVRIFSHDKLSSDVAAEQWDIVKIVCTQPFNKRVPYGLTFVKLHSLSEKGVEKMDDSASLSTDVKPKIFGSFKMKDDSDASKSSTFHPGKLMQLAKKDESSESKIKKEHMRRSRSPDARELEEKRRKLDQKATPKQQRHPATPKQQRPPATPKQQRPSATPVNFDQLKTKIPPPKLQKREPPKQPPSSSKKRKAEKKKTPAKPYDQILGGVIFVISGFQNPLRGEIRDKALRMGAQYRKDWTRDSTHLVCAFPNTPKYRQVEGAGGRIVRKEWIDDCAKMKRQMSWKKYAMNGDVSSSSSSSECEDASSEDEPTVNVNPSQQSDNEDPYGGSTDEGGDTEDEIKKLKPKIEEDKQSDNVYDASTDEENGAVNQPSADGLPPLPDFFEHKQFLLYGDFEQSIQRLLTRCIVACGGKISKYMNDDIEYVVTEQDWDQEFDRALSTNAALVFVTPSWVYDCGAQQRLLPSQPYLISHT